MNLLKVLSVAAIACSFAFTTVGDDKDPLNRKKYNAMATEIKDGKPSTRKPVPDEIEFKKGKAYSSLVYDKTDGLFSEVKYVITKDSTYTDEGEEKRYFEVEAITSDDKGQTINMFFVINGYDIEATYKVIKKDIVKKHFTSTGKEKVKEKKKKEKD